MASLLKRENSPYWFAAFDVPQPDGTYRRIKRSTKKRKRSEAMGEALRMEEAERKGGLVTVEQAAKAYSIVSEAASAAAKGELSEGRARELIARLCEISTGQPLRFYTVRSWGDEWLAMKTATAKPATMARYRTHLDTFNEWLGSRADSRLEAITKADVRQFRDDIRVGWTKGKPKATPRTAATTNHFASDVAGMFRAAMREGLILASPCAALGKLSETDSTEREVFSVAEVGRLVGAASDSEWLKGLYSTGKLTDEEMAARCADWQGMILMGFYAGIRIGDCGRLTWANINLRQKILTFMPSKTERKRKKLEVPLHPRLLAFLENRAKNAGKNDPLFPALASTRPGGQHGLSSQFIAIMEHAEIDRRTVRAGTKGGQRAQHARSFHALRHSLTSILANADVPEEIRRRIVGHESADVHAGYTHTERETLARALEKLPSI